MRIDGDRGPGSERIDGADLGRVARSRSNDGNGGAWSRLAALEPRAALDLVQHAEEDLDDAWIEGAPPVFRDHLPGLLVGEGAAVGTLARHRDVGVHQRDDAGPEGNLLAADPVRITFPTPALVVVQHDRDHFLGEIHLLEDLRAADRVLLDERPFLLGEVRRVLQDEPAHGDHADVAQHGAVDEGFQVLLGIVEEPRHRAHVAHHALGASLGVSVAALDQGHHPAHQPEVPLLLGPLHARVGDRDRALVGEDRQEIPVVLAELPPAAASAHEEHALEVAAHPHQDRPLEAGLAEGFHLVRAALLSFQVLHRDERAVRTEFTEHRPGDDEVLEVRLREASDVARDQVAVLVGIDEEERQALETELSHDAQAEEIHDLVEILREVQRLGDLEEIPEFDDLPLQLGLEVRHLRPDRGLGGGYHLGARRLGRRGEPERLRGGSRRGLRVSRLHSCFSCFSSFSCFSGFSCLPSTYTIAPGFWSDAWISFATPHSSSRRSVLA